MSQAKHRSHNTLIMLYLEYIVKKYQENYYQQSYHVIKWTNAYAAFDRRRNIYRKFFSCGITCACYINTWCKKNIWRLYLYFLKVFALIDEFLWWLIKLYRYTYEYVKSVFFFQRTRAIITNTRADKTIRHVNATSSYLTFWQNWVFCWF